MKLHLREDEGQTFVACRTTFRDAQGNRVAVNPLTLMTQLEYVFGEDNVRMNRHSPVGVYEYSIPGDAELDEVLQWLQRNRSTGAWSVIQVEARRLFTGEPIGSLSRDELEDAVEAMKASLRQAEVHLTLRQVLESIGDSAD